MDLTIKNEENIDHMLTIIKKKLQLVNQDVLRAEAFSTDHYDELFDIYQLVERQSSFSVREMEGILDELKVIRQPAS